MLCASHEEHVNLFLDGLLPVEAQIELFKHLALCPGCRDFVEKTNRFRLSARRESLAFPEKLDQTIFEEILRRRRFYAHKPQPARLFSSWLRPVALPRFAFAAMMFLLLLLGGLEVYDRLNPPAPVPAQQIMLPNANPVGVIYIIAQPAPAELPTTISPDTTIKKGVPHEPENPAVNAFVSLWSAVLVHDGFCAG